MAIFRSLRSQSHHLNLIAFHLPYPPISSFIFFNQNCKNPNFSRHFQLQPNSRFIHSISRKSFPESPPLVANSQNVEQTQSNSPTPEPVSDQNPKRWSVFSSNSSDATADSSVKEDDSVPSHPVMPKGRKGKSKMYWVCTDCGHSGAQWWGTCKSCGQVGTVKQISVAEPGARGRVSGVEISENAMRSWLPHNRAGHSTPVRLVDVTRGANKSDWRIQLYGNFGAEVARVLGGGVVPGSLVLVGGDPGVGKSTLLLQIASLIAESVDVSEAGPVVYVSGEESVEQIGNRADRLSIEAEDLFLYSSTDVEDIIKKAQSLSPRAVVIDSVQTIYLKGIAGSPGGTAQVKECTAALLRFSKDTDIPVLLIGHVNKSGDIAGPQMLEHIVDVVLYMEGEKHTSHRLLRSVKNRYGSTDELGIFEMSESGLQAVLNPSQMFLSEVQLESDHLPGIAVAVVIDGSRTFLIEVQALYVADSSGRHINGVRVSRADMIISVLNKQAGLRMQDSCIYLNVVSGASLTETSGDLAVAAAICSSYLEFPIPNDVAFIGEVGLGGELRMVSRIEKRVSAVAQLGYKTCVVPKAALKALAALSSEIQIVGCKNLKEVIDKVFRKV